MVRGKIVTVSWYTAGYILHSYCLDNLRENGIFYVQGMTDILAPLLVVIDDGMWSVMHTHICRCVYVCRHIHIYIYMHAYEHSYILLNNMLLNNMHTQTRMYIHTGTCTHNTNYICTDAHIYTNIDTVCTLNYLLYF